MPRKLPFARDNQPENVKEGIVEKVYSGTVKVSIGSTPLGSVTVAPPLLTDDIAVGDVVAVSWIRNRAYVTSILGQKTQSRESRERTKPPPAPVNVTVVGNYLKWSWGGTDEQRKVLAGYELDVRAPGGTWGYGSYPLPIGIRESYSPTVGTQVQCRIRAVDVFNNVSAWVESSSSSLLPGSDAVLRDGSTELTNDWNVGNHAVTVQDLVATSGVDTADLEADRIGVGTTPPDEARVHIVASNGEGTPTITAEHLLVAQSNSNMSGAGIAVVGSHFASPTASLMLGRASKIDMVRLQYTGLEEQAALVVNDMLALVVTYDLSMSAVGLSAIDMSAMGHLSAVGRFAITHEDMEIAAGLGIRHGDNVTDGYVLRADGTKFVPARLDLDDLGNVNAGSPNDNNVLAWDSATSKWIAEPGGVGGGVTDAADLTYTPAVAADWDGDADPGDADEALDQLAERVDDLEGAGAGDAADVTYTPAVAADWDSDADPGDVDEALDQLAERVDDLEGGMVNIGARVYNSGAIAIANNTWTTLTFDSERYDTDTIHSTVTNTSRLTATTAGTYLIVLNVSIQDHVSGGTRAAQIMLGGATVLAVDMHAPSTSAGHPTSICVSTIYALSATNYVEAQVYQNSGGALNALASANYSPEFSMQRIA